jgi:hypothetical protein
VPKAPLADRGGKPSAAFGNVLRLKPMNQSPVIA